MNRTTVTALVGGGALAALALVGSLLRSGPAELAGAAAERGAAGPADAARTKASLERPDELAAQAGPGAGTVGTAAEPEERARREEGRIALAAEAGGLELELVGPDEAPCPGAEVWLLQNATKSTRKAFRDAQDPEAWMREHGVERTADASGRLRITVPHEGPTAVVARSGELWGRESIDEDIEGTVRIQLERDATLVVQVIDAAGTPLPGIKVEIRRSNSAWSYPVTDRETADPDGVARFQHVQEILVRNSLGASSWKVGVEGALDPWVQEPIDPDALPAEPVTLVLPATGAVELRVFDESGALLEGDGKATLGVVRKGEPRKLSPFSSQGRQRVDRPVEDGVARFPVVGLGCELELAAHRAGSNVDTHVYGIGPTAPGQTVQFELQLGTDHPVVRLRALGEDRAPLVRAKLAARIDYMSRHMQNANELSVVTGDDGMVNLDLEGHWAEGTERKLTLQQGPREQPEGTAVLDLSRKLENGLNDLGDVVLGAAPVFVAGRVVDASGAGVPGAKLLLRHRSQGRSWWDLEYDFDQEADEAGFFEVRGSWSADEFKLGATDGDLACEMVPFTPGERDLRIELRGGGFIVGSVLLDEGIPHDAVDVHIVSHGDGRLDHLDDRGAHDAPDEDGEFRLGPLLAGTYAVRVNLDDVNEPLLLVEDVVVPGGSDVRDPRLDRIDLRGRLFLHEVVLVPPEGHDAALQGGIQFGPAGAEQLTGNAWLDGAEKRIVSESELLDLVVAARGFRAERREGVREKVTIPLRTGLVARLVLRGTARLPEPPVYVKAGLARPESSFEDLDWGAPTFDEEREIQVKVAAPGRLRVTWILEKRSANSAVATMASVEPEEFVEVLDVQGVQTIEVHLTDEQMQSILSALD